MENRNEWHPCSCGTVKSVEDRVDQMLVDMAASGECIMYALAVGVALTRAANNQVQKHAELAKRHGDHEEAQVTYEQAANVVHVLGRRNEDASGDEVRRINDVYQKLYNLHTLNGTEKPKRPNRG